MFQVELDEASTFFPFFCPPPKVSQGFNIPSLCSVIKQLVIKTSARKSRKFTCAEKGPNCFRSLAAVSAMQIRLALIPHIKPIKEKI